MIAFVRGEVAAVGLDTPGPASADGVIHDVREPIGVQDDESVGASQLENDLLEVLACRGREVEGRDHPGDGGDVEPDQISIQGLALREEVSIGDYVLSGDWRWKDVNNKLVSFIKDDCGGDPTRIALGYQLDGTATERSYPPRATIGCMIGGALVDGAHQEFLNSLWTYTANNLSRDYYDSELQLLPMIVASGNWWAP